MPGGEIEGLVELAKRMLDGFQGRNELSVGPNMLAATLERMVAENERLSAELNASRERELHRVFEAVRSDLSPVASYTAVKQSIRAALSTSQQEKGCADPEAQDVARHRDDVFNVDGDAGL